VRSLLADTKYSPDGEMRLELRGCDGGLCLAKQLLPRLIVFGFEDLALELAHSMAKSLVADSAPLHWILRFAAAYRPYLSAGLREVFVGIVKRLPRASGLFRLGNGGFEIAERLLEIDATDPDVLAQEFSSPYLHAHTFAVCSLLLSSRTSEAIANELVSPIFDLSKTWPNRDRACLALARVAASLSVDIGYAYFEALIGGQCGEMAVKSGHCFILNIGTTLLKNIAVNGQTLIGGDVRKLDYYVRLFTPGFQKLEGAPAEAVAVLAGLLDSLSESTPKSLQETVVDVVSTVYWDLNLEKSKARLLKSAANLDPDLAMVLGFAFEPLPPM
jgi:hypothetical protein